MARRKKAPPELAIVVEGLNPPNLQIAQDVLKMAGIPSWVRDQNISELFRGRGGNVVPVKLMVPLSDLSRARAALKKLKVS